MIRSRRNRIATEIGTITALVGTATATSTDGSIRNLQVGDKVNANDLITTGASGAIEIEFKDGSMMDLGRNSQAMLDRNVFDLQAADEEKDPVSDSDESIVDIQQLLLEGEDPTAVSGTSPASGNTGLSNGGHYYVSRDFQNTEVTPTSGFETSGPGLNRIEDSADLNLINRVPSAGLTDVVLDEDHLASIDDPVLSDGASAEFLAFITAEPGFEGFGFETRDGFYPNFADTSEKLDNVQKNPRICAR